MDMRVIFTTVTVALAASVASAQDRVSSPPEASVPPNAVLTDPNSPVSNVEIFGKRSSGLDAPVSATINMLYSHSNIRSWLSRSDRLLFDSARVNSDRRVKRSIVFEDVCRKALLLSGRDISLSEAADFGRQLNEAEEVTNQMIVDTYHAMLETLSADGAELIEETRVGIHKHMGAIEYDWEQQAQADPNLISNYARNCTISE